VVVFGQGFVVGDFLFIVPIGWEVASEETLDGLLNRFCIVELEEKDEVDITTARWI